MAEYIMYVMIIFIPIGGLLAYLLYKDGVSIKYISLIVLVVLLIILSFPISIEKLGALISVGIYILLLAIITVYLYKSKIAGYGEVVAAPGISAGDDNEADNIAWLEQSRPLTSESYDFPATPLEDAGAPGLLTKEKVDAGDYSEEIVGQEYREIAGESAGLAEAEVEPLEIEASEPQKVELVEPEVSEPEEIELTEPEIPEPGEIESTEPEVSEPEEIESTEPEEIKSTEPEAELQETGLGPDPIEESAGLMPEATELISEDLTVVSSDTMITALEEPALSEPALPGDSALKQVNDLIDYAFSCRFSDPTQAALYFEEVVKLTSDYELKYLVAMELTEIYKELGAYTKAVTALQSFSVLPDHKSDIINEISRQLEYISLLASELNRLGMGDFPVSRIPRWVRLKIDEQMNPRQYR